MPPKERQKLQPRPNQEPLQGYHGWENVTPRDVRYDAPLPVQYQYPSGGQTVVSDVEPSYTDFGARYRAGPPTEGFSMTPEWQWPEGIINTGKGYDTLLDYMDYPDAGKGWATAEVGEYPKYDEVAKRTSFEDPSSWLDTDWWNMAARDIIKDRDPGNKEALDYYKNLMERDAMSRDPNFQVTLPEHEKLGKLSGYELLPKGVYPYFNPHLIEGDSPTFGLDYMTDLWGGKGRVGFRKGLDDDDYNVYAGLGFNF